MYDEWAILETGELIGNCNDLAIRLNIIKDVSNGIF